MNPDARYLLDWAVRFSSAMFGMGAILITALTWLAAYTEGGSVMVTINDYGEMSFELGMWCVLGPMFVYGMSMVIYGIWKDGRDNRKRLKRVFFGREDVLEEL